MKLPLTCALILAAAVTCRAAAEPPRLYENKVADVPVENGKRLNMSVRETVREPTHSIVEVEFVSGGSVSSSMFVLKSTCALARERKANQFSMTRLEGKPARFQIDFDAAAVQPSGQGGQQKFFTVTQCDLLGK